MMKLLIMVPLGAITALLLMAIFSLLYKSASWGLKLVLCLFIWETLVVSLPSISFGINIFPQDAIFFILGISGISRFILGQVRFTGLKLCWLVFGILLFASFIRGIFDYGLLTAGVDFREFFYLWSGTLYFMSFSYQSIFQIKWTRLFIFTALVLLSIAIVRWLTDGLGITSWGEHVGAGSFRVLNAQQAFFIAEAFAILLVLEVLQRLPRWQLSLLPIFGFALLILQHRTIWTTIIALFVLLWWREQRARIRLLSLSLGLLSLFFVASLVGLSVFEDQLGNLENAITHSYSSISATDEKSTFNWRIQGWQALLTDIDTPSKFLLGKPFGAGYRRFIIGNDFVGVTNAPPHNYYVQTFLQVGIVGLVILVGVYTLMLFSFNKREQIDLQWCEQRILWFIIAMQLIYYIGYSPNFEQSIGLGFAISYAQAYSDKQGKLSRFGLNV